MVWAKSPLACSTSSRLENWRSSRWKARSSSVRPLPSVLARVAEQGSGLAEKIQGDIGQGDVGLEFGRLWPTTRPIAERG